MRGAAHQSNSARYNADSVNNATVGAATGSSLASYWPYCAYVNRNNEVAVVGSLPYTAAQLSPSSNWTVTSLGKSAMPGSRLAVVPLVSNVANLYGAGGYGVFYQDTNGNLVYTQPNRPDADTSQNLVDSWPTGKSHNRHKVEIINLTMCQDVEFPPINLAVGGSFAAFTTKRPDSSSGRVNTYVLYQEISSRISMIYLENDSSWVRSQPEAMSIADNGTDIACLTMPISQKGGDEKELELEEASSHANRCYFQRGGYLREFALSGTDWIELGTIPMN